MSENEKLKLSIALGVLSGRLDASSLDADYLELLGYDPYKFGYYGKPSADEVRRKAEEVIYFAITEAAEHRVQADVLPCGHPVSSWKLGGCGEGCIECANAATSR